MKYCTKCGAEILDEAVICPHCGCMTNESLQVVSKSNGMETAVKVFMIIGCVASAFLYLIPLAWTIPMTVIIINRLKKHQPIGMAFKVCTLLFCSLVAGILLLCMDTEKYTHN